ncbi:MAG: ATP-binding protein [Alistipes sp.]|nr:ATP-binding protein [Candidatus Alistipes equi]
MDKLYARHDNYMSEVPMEYVRGISNRIDWNSRLIILKGQKGVGKSTMMKQYIKQNYSPDDRHVLYCSADTSYFTTHTLEEVADKFVMLGGTHLFIDEIHKYPKWSQEIKEIYDAHKNLKVVLSGSSLIKLNDGDADLSRRMVPYMIPGLSLREYIALEKKLKLPSVALYDLLANPNSFCTEIKKHCAPLEYFKKYLAEGYYPYFFESRNTYPIQVENVIDYIINNELPSQRGLEVGNARKVKALMKIISQMVPFEVDTAKISKSIGIQRTTLLKYMKDLEEAKLIVRLFQDLSTITDFQKPDKILLDNPNIINILSDVSPQIGSLRESFFVNQLQSAGHVIEYGGLSTGDFKVNGDIVVEVGGSDKGFGQIKNANKGYVAADDIDSATFRKIPLWAFGFLY